MIVTIFCYNTHLPFDNTIGPNSDMLHFLSEGDLFEELSDLYFLEFFYQKPCKLSDIESM